MGSEKSGAARGRVPGAVRCTPQRCRTNTAVDSRPKGPLIAMIALTVALAVVVGISLGLLGGGGSILMVPLLTYIAGMDAKQAIATSLLGVGVTSTVSTI